ncbi:MAG: hypothetical protein LBD18_06910 [Treponema sp.]|jgi:hypothetical protein|nr:hypothetical protein [Treponema sp.]
MKKSVCLQLILFCFFTAFPLSAATVSVLVIETGLPRESPASQYSSLWESGILDVFFEAGHIVSNAPLLRLPGKPSAALPSEAEGEMDAALDGGMDYFILALLDYPVSQGREILQPRNVSLRLFKTKPKTMICEREYTDNIPRSMKEIYENLKKTVQGLIPYLQG